MKPWLRMYVWALTAYCSLEGIVKRIYRRMPGKMTWTHHCFAGNSSFSQALSFEVLIFFNLSQIYLFVCFICWNIIPSKILSSNIIWCKFCIHNANGIFKSWEFYHSRPFARNKQSIHVGFPAVCTHSRLSAGHTTICSVVYPYIKLRL